MSTLRISNIEAKADNSSPTVDEQLKFTNSTGDLMLYLDGRTSGITTVGINTTNQTIKFDANNNVMVTGIITATEFHGTLAVGTSVTYGDNEKAYFGNGLDFSIYHNGSASYLDETGTGGLIAKTNTAFQVFNSAGSQAAFTATPGGSVQLYHNTTERLSTDGNGISVTGNINMLTDSTLYLGVGNDFRLFHNGTTNYIRSTNGNIIIDNNSGVINAKFIPAGASELYFNSGRKIETTNTGAVVTGILTATSFKNADGSDVGADLTSVDSNIVPDGDNTRTIGSTSNHFVNVFTRRVEGPDSNFINLLNNGDVGIFAKSGSAVEIKGGNNTRGLLIGNTGVIPTHSAVNLGASGDKYNQVHAQTFHGDGSNLTSLPAQATIANNADNRVITGGSGVNLNGEANLTFNGGATGDAQLTVHAEQNDSGADSELILETSNDFATSVVMFKDSTAEAGSIAYNHGDNYIKLSTNGTNGGTERLRIASDGKVSISNDGTTDGLLTIKGNSDQVGTPSIRLLDGSDTREVSITNTSGDFVASVHGNDNAIHGHIKMFESGIFSVANGGSSGTNTERLRIAANGVATFSGNVTVGYDTTYSPIQQAAKTWYYTRADQAGSVSGSNIQNLATGSIKVNETIPISNMSRQSDAGAHSIYNSSSTSGSCTRDMSSADPFHPKAHGLTMGTLFRAHTSGNNGSGVIHYGANSTSEHFYIRYKYSSVGLNIGCDTNGSDVWTTMYQNDLVSDNNWYFVVIAVERNGTLLTSLNGAPLTPIRMLGTAPAPGNARFGVAGDPYADNDSRHRYATAWWYKGVISNELIAQEYAWLKTIWTGASLP